MAARGMLSVVGSAVGGLIGWDTPEPAADPAAVRESFAALGVRVGPAERDLTAVVQRFQEHTGLAADGVAGAQTVHLLAQYADRARELRTLAHATDDLAA